MSTKVFDTHDNPIIADRVITNLRSLGFEWSTGVGPDIIHRYIFSSDESVLMSGKIIRHSETNYINGGRPCYDCAWMAEDEVLPAPPIPNFEGELTIRQIEEMQRMMTEQQERWMELQVTPPSPSYVRVGPRLRTYGDR